MKKFTQLATTGAALAAAFALASCGRNNTTTSPEASPSPSATPEATATPKTMASPSVTASPTPATPLPAEPSHTPNATVTP